MIKNPLTFKQTSMASILIFLFAVFPIPQTYADGNGTLTLQSTSGNNSLSVVDAVVAPYYEGFFVLLFDQTLNAEDRKTPYKKLKSKAAGHIQLICEGKRELGMVRKCRISIDRQPSGFADLEKGEFKLSGFQCIFPKSYSNSTSQFSSRISGKSKELTTIDRYLRPVGKSTMALDVSINCSSFVPFE